MADQRHYLSTDVGSDECLLCERDMRSVIHFRTCRTCGDTERADGRHNGECPECHQRASELGQKMIAEGLDG